MANNVIDAAIRLRDLFTPTVRSVNASLGTMKTQMAAAKQSVSGLSDKLTEHERIQKRTAKSIEQTGGKISGCRTRWPCCQPPSWQPQRQASSCTVTLPTASPRFRPWWIRRSFPCRRSVMKSVLSAMKPGQALPTFPNRSTRPSQRVSMPAML
jgi:hypothetical protein